MSDPSGYIDDSPSPSGRFLVRTVAMEMRMSLWVHAPVVLDGDEEIARLGGLWSAERVEWVREEVVALKLRRYPNGSAFYTVVIDCARRAFSVEAGAPQPLSALGATLDALADRRRR